MSNSPQVEDITQELKRFLYEELRPALADENQRFQCAIAARLIGIIEREWLQRDACHNTEAQALEQLSTLLAADRQAPEISLHGICEALDKGILDTTDNTRLQAVLAALRPLSAQKLSINSPRYGDYLSSA